jgi:hypothetical protein
VNPIVDTLEYVAVAHLDKRARDIAQIMLDHPGDPRTAIERILEWHEDNKYMNVQSEDW